MQNRHPIPATISDQNRPKKRGNYNCGRCGLPKKGYNCHLRSPFPPPSPSTPIHSQYPSRLRQPYPFLRRALSYYDAGDQTERFDPMESDDREAELSDCFDVDSCGLPASVLWEVMRRLPPMGLLSAAIVCKGWNEMARRVWRAAEELSLRVPPKAHVEFVASILQKCTNIVRLSLRLESNVDSTMLACIAFSCPNLEFIEISTCNAAINRINGEGLSQFVADKPSLKCLKMEGCSNLGGVLRKLSLVLGSEITDASVAAIASSFPNLELLDLNGSSVSDSGIGMICNVFPKTLSRLLLALCPNVTSSGIQFATAQLQRLELMDCGMTICDPNSENPMTYKTNSELLKKSSINLPVVNQKLIIKHSRLKKLSLWGCTGLGALYLNCPQLVDLNLNSCTNLHPERLLLQCPHLVNVHASGCQNILVGAIQSQVRYAYTDMESLSPSKRLPDGSKRIQAPCFHSTESPEEDKKRRRIERRLCNVIVDC